MLAMEFKCNRKDFLAAVQKASQALPSRATVLPVLNGVKVSAEESGRVWLEATDLEASIRTGFAAEVAVPGTVVVPCRTLLEILRRVDGEVRLAGVGENRALLEYAGGSLDLAGYAPEQFPVFPTVEDGAAFNLEAETLAAVAKRVAAICAGEAGPIFQGVLWEAGEDGRLRWAATDTHRLAVLEGPEVSGSWRRVVPGAVVQLAARLAAEQDGLVSVTVGSSQIAFQSEDFTVVARLVEGVYPKWQSVFPREFAARLTVDAGPFVAALERAAMVARETADKNRAGVVKLRFGGGTVEVSAHGDAGNLTETIPAETEGEGEVFFNSRYLLEALDCAGAGQRTIAFGAQFSAAVVEGDGYRHLVLPVVLNAQVAA